MTPQEYLQTIEADPPAPLPTPSPLPPTIDTLISANLLTLIKTNPGFTFLSGMVRAETGVKLTGDMTTESILKQLEGSIAEIAKFKKPIGTPPAQARSGQAAAPQDAVPINVEYYEDVYGSTQWTRRDTYTGTLMIPRSVMQQAAEDDNSEVVLGYIEEHYSDLNYDSGDEEYGDSNVNGTSEAGLDNADSVDRQVNQWAESNNITPT